MNKQKKFKLISLATVATIGTIAACAIPTIASTTTSQDMTIYNKKETKMYGAESPTNSLPTFPAKQSEWNIQENPIFQSAPLYTDVTKEVIQSEKVANFLIQVLNEHYKDMIDFTGISDELNQQISKPTNQNLYFIFNVTISYLKGTAVIPKIDVVKGSNPLFSVKGPITFTGFVKGNPDEISTHLDEQVGSANIKEFMYEKYSRYSSDYSNANIEKINIELANLSNEELTKLNIFSNLAPDPTTKPYSLRIEEVPTSWSIAKEITTKTYNVIASTTLYREIDNSSEGYGNLTGPQEKTVTYSFTTEAYTPVQASDIISNNLINDVVSNASQNQPEGMTQDEFNNLIKETLAQTIAENIHKTIQPINQNDGNSIEVLKASIIDKIRVESASVNNDSQAPWKVTNITIDLDALNGILPETSKLNSASGSLQINWSESNLAAATTVSRTTTWVASVLAIVLLLMLIVLILALIKNKSSKEDKWLENATDRNLVL